MKKLLPLALICLAGITQSRASGALWWTIESPTVTTSYNSGSTAIGIQDAGTIFGSVTSALTATGAAGTSNTRASVYSSGYYQLTWVSGDDTAPPSTVYLVLQGEGSAVSSAAGSVVNNHLDSGGAGASIAATTGFSGWFQLSTPATSNALVIGVSGIGGRGGGSGASPGGASVTFNNESWPINPTWTLVSIGPPYWIWQTTSPNWIKVVSPTATSSASYTLMYSTENIIASAAGVYKQSVHFVPGS